LPATGPAGATWQQYIRDWAANATIRIQQLLADVPPDRLSEGERLLQAGQPQRVTELRLNGRWRFFQASPWTSANIRLVLRVCMNLRRLTVKNVAPRTWPLDFGVLPALESVALVAAPQAPPGAQGPAALNLHGCAQLQRLSLRGFDWSSLPLHGLSALTELELIDNRELTTLDLRGLCHLEVLVLGECPNLRLLDLRRLSHLKRIWVWSCPQLRLVEVRGASGLGWWGTNLYDRPPARLLGRKPPRR
jgi:hypothetical protein